MRSLLQRKQFRKITISKISEEIMKESEILRKIDRKLGLSDDCGIIPFRDTNLVFTTDMLHKKTDFPPGITFYTIGWRSAAVSLSDLAAMGSRPLALTVAYGAPDLDWKNIEPILDGVVDCCRQVKCQYCGGDLDRHDEMTLASSAIGVTENPVTRNGARPGDKVILSGKLGKTALGLLYFKKGRLKEANELFRFLPEVPTGLALGEFATAMMDISDGLAHSLYQLAEASKVGFIINYKNLPVRDEINSLPLNEEERMEMTLYKGEDYQLLCTIPPKDLEKALQINDHITIIGEVKEKGIFLEKDGLTELADKGYEH